MQSQPENSPTQDALQAARIVVCADDYGIEPGVDAGIVELAAAGRLSAVSCLTGSPGFAARARDLVGLDVDLGLHLNFTESLGGAGVYRSHPVLVALAYTRRLKSTGVRAQIMDQLDRFEQHAGRAPDFVDGHLHVHQLPVIRDQLIDVVLSRYAVSPPWLRDTVPGELDRSLPFMQRFKPQVIDDQGKTVSRPQSVEDDFLHPPDVAIGSGLANWQFGTIPLVGEHRDMGGPTVIARCIAQLESQLAGLFPFNPGIDDDFTILREVG